MVTPPPFRGRWAVLALALVLGGDAVAVTPPEADADRAVRSALRQAAFPWYDAEADGVKAVPLPHDREPARSNDPAGPAPPRAAWTWGETVVFALFVAALAAVVGLAAWSWRRYEPGADAEVPAPRGGGPSRRSRCPRGLAAWWPATTPGPRQAAAAAPATSPVP